MIAHTQVAGLAVLCNAQGVIVRVAYNGLSLGDYLGQTFTALIDQESFEKACSFLETIQTQGRAFNWELNVPVGEKIKLLHFAGSRTADGVFIAGATTRSGVAQLCEHCVRIDTEAQTPEVRREPQALSTRAEIDGDSEHYDELTRLNNELLTLQRDLIKKNIELERLHEQKNQFIGMAAHELRNPLQVINIICQILLHQNGGKLTKEQSEFIALLNKNSNFMLKLINDLLAVSKLESGKLQLELRLIDLASFIKSSVALNSLLAEQKQIQLIFDHDTPSPEILVDPSKIEQVLNNLISNAIKFSYPHTTITVTLTQRENGMVISVKDEGQGIPQNEFSNLFKPFEKISVRGTADEQGTGLGLTITREVVLAHKGEIWVESEVGKGTTFYVLLPFSQRHAA